MQMVSLEEFIQQDDRQDRGRPQFFVGRSKELAAFSNTVKLVRNGQTSGKTLVFQGAPGAGKTALLRECAAIARQKKCIPVEVEPGQLTSVDGLFREVQREVERNMQGAAVSVAEFLRNLSERGITVQGFGFGASVSPKTRDELDPVSKFRELAAAWTDLTVVVLVDEAQNIPVTDVSQALVTYFHAGTKESNILLACFGLSDTTAKLSELGISRLSFGRVHDMTPLEIPEAEQSIRQAFDAFGVAGAQEQRQHWTRELAQSSQGWPQHLVILTKPALQELKDHGLDVTHGSLQRVLAKGEAGKAAYYSARLAATGRWRNACRAVARELKGHAWLPEQEIERVVTPFVQSRQSSFDDFLAAAVHSGLLGPVSDKGFAVPIPSFAEYLREDVRAAMPGAEYQAQQQLQIDP